ncbi:response regulator transcription factor [Geovibrio ferrireducens]|uniref:response regulator transcription factor n=1 Tax=Geovibrio ferrireducens TaxID=46201 RepID=UPI0022464300|nr:response regulator transcription factor [Geovibrio ferrireducens]
MKILKTADSRMISNIGFSLMFSFTLSFLFEGQVFYGLAGQFGSDPEKYIFSGILAQFAGLFSCGFFVRNLKQASRTATAGMAVCLLTAVPFFFEPSVLWSVCFTAANYASGCALASWGYFLMIFTPKNQRIKSCADLLIFSNILMIIVNITTEHTSPSAGLALALLFLAAGLTVILNLNPAHFTPETETVKRKETVRTKKPMIMLYLFIFIITINSGLMYQVVNPAFAHLSELASLYWSIPYIIALTVMRSFYSKMKRSVVLYTGMATLGASFICFILLGRNAADYLIVNTLMLGAFGIFDLFWWSIIGEILDYTDNPAKTFGIGLSANVLGILLGRTIGMTVTSARLSDAEIVVIALSVVCVTLALLPPLNRMLVALIKKHVYLSDEESMADYEYKPATGQSRVTEPLTSRETEVLRLILTGKSNKAIADELFISESTVKTHTRNIFSKYNVNSRSELFSILLNNRTNI